MNFHTRAVICCDFYFPSCAVMLSHLFGFLSEVAAHSDNNKMVPGEWGCAEQRIRDGGASLPQSVRLCVQMQLTHLPAVCACLSSLPQLAHFVFLCADNLAIGTLRISPNSALPVAKRAEGEDR